MKFRRPSFSRHLPAAFFRSRPTAALGISAALLFPVSVGANVVLEIDFEAAELDVPPAPPFIDQNAQGLRFVRDDETATPFGEGNRFLQLGGPNLRIRSNVPITTWSALSTVAFDFSEPTDVGDQPILFGLGAGSATVPPDINATWGVFVFGLNNGTLSTSSNTTLESGEIAALETGRVYRLALVFNRSAETASYPDPRDPEESQVELPPGRAAMWILDHETELWTESGVFSTSQALAPQNFIFRSFSTGNSELHVDNVVIRNTANAVPPPPPLEWTGLGADPNWSTGANWLGGIAPEPGRAIRFAGFEQVDAENDFPEDSAFPSLDFGADALDFVLTGNRVVLSEALTSSSTFNQTLALEIALPGELRVEPTAGALWLEGALSGPGGLVKTGAGALELSGENRQLGRTTVQAGSVVVIGDQSAADGGWQVGPLANQSASVEFVAGSRIRIREDATLRIGNTAAAGGISQVLTVAGEVVNDGSLLVGRPGILHLESGATWTQNGPLRLAAQGGFNALLNIRAGASLDYRGDSPLAIDAATANSGQAILTVDGGLLVTASPLVAGTTPNESGFSRLALSNGGELRLAADLPQLSDSVQVDFGPGGGSIDTAGFDAALATPPQGVGSLTKHGAGLLELTAGSTHAGDTRVAGGTLALGSASLEDGSAVEVTDGALLRLDFSGEDLVAALTLGGVAAEPGTVWGGPDSGAPLSSPLLAGEGRLRVAAGPAEGSFEEWIAAFPTLDRPELRAPEADPDEDGQSNFTEFALDGDPTSGIRSGKVVGRLLELDGQPVFVFTLPVLEGAEANEEGSTLVLSAGAARYLLRAERNLDGDALGLIELEDAAAADLPALSAGYRYRSFRISDPEAPAAFVRVTVEQP